MPIEQRSQAAINPYAAPAARVADAPRAAGEPAFFAVGMWKLTLMSLFTLGLYEIYWFYRNWKAVRELTGEKLNAPIRALFYPLTSYGLFRRMQEQGRASMPEFTLNGGPLATTIFVLSALSRLPDPFWLVALLTFLPLLPVQAEVNAINRKLAPKADLNTGYSGWNIAGLVVGGIFVALILVGLFVDDA